MELGVLLHPAVVVMIMMMIMMMMKKQGRDTFAFLPCRSLGTGDLTFSSYNG